MTNAARENVRSFMLSGLAILVVSGCMAIIGQRFGNPHWFEQIGVGFGVVAGWYVRRRTRPHDRKAEIPN
jgi:hypothetical protein